MAHVNPPDDVLRELLTSASVIAVVGASGRPERPSHGVMRVLLRRGYRVIPVTPNETMIVGQRAYPSLAEIPEPVDIVDVFRRAEYTPAIADQAVAIGARALWLQQGIVNADAAAGATAGGLVAIMDLCIAQAIVFLGIRSPAA